MKNPPPSVTNHIRRLLLKTIYHAGSGHPGGALSAVDIIVQLYFHTMDFDASRHDALENDRFILSKGHACAALYATLALRGLLEREVLKGFRQLNGVLQGHPHITTPWINASSGSLGQGVSNAIGIAYGLQHQHIPARVYCLLGDGECQEGMIWEAAMFAAHHRLTKLCLIVDYNQLQSDAPVAAIMGIEPLADKWRAFGWRVHACDGHDGKQLQNTFRACQSEQQAPSLIIAHTVKGKGISFMENNPAWHGALTLSEQDYTASLRELGVTDADMGDYLNSEWWDVSA